jgi:hypothetical protein
MNVHLVRAGNEKNRKFAEIVIKTEQKKFSMSVIDTYTCLGGMLQNRRNQEALVALIS